MNTTKALMLGILCLLTPYTFSEQENPELVLQTFEEMKDKINNVDVAITLYHEKEYNLQAWQGILNATQAFANDCNTKQWEDPEFKQSFAQYLAASIIHISDPTMHGSISVNIGTSQEPREEIGDEAVIQDDSIIFELKVGRTDIYDIAQWEDIVHLVTDIITNYNTSDYSNEELKKISVQFTQGLFNKIAISDDALNKAGLTRKMHIMQHN